MEPFLKYQDILGHIYDAKSPAIDSIFDFKKALLFSHEFQGEMEDSNGWISFLIDFNTDVTENLSLVVFTNVMTKLTVDEYGNVTKELL